ncbi:MAG: hypothetical protein C4547_01280 [Phycisphaerales bacterium]|nr:MAG: hypothetical protein C4547_01280 [Phycisphaerales bacterium]
MSAHLGAICDEFYVSTRLFLKLDMALERETVLHFFDRLRRDFPDLCRFRRREDGCLLLEGDRDAESGRRWIRLDGSSLRMGHTSPTDVDEVRKFTALVLEQAPFHLTFSELDYDHMDVVYGFDLDYRGNHDLLLADTIWRDHPLSSFLMADRAVRVIDAQPYLGIALRPECDLQAYLEVKSRTHTFEVRSDEFEKQAISVFLTARQYWGVNGSASLVEVAGALFDVCDELAAEQVVPSVVNPLAAAIASRS